MEGRKKSISKHVSSRVIKEEKINKFKVCLEGDTTGYLTHFYSQKHKTLRTDCSR